MHGKICPCLNCSGGRGGGLLAGAVAVVLIAIAVRAAAAAITPFVHAVVTAVCTGLLVLCMTAVAVYIGCSALSDRRRRANAARAMPVDELAARRSASRSEPQQPEGVNARGHT